MSIRTLLMLGSLGLLGLGGCADPESPLLRHELATLRRENEALRKELAGLRAEAQGERARDRQAQTDALGELKTALAGLELRATRAEAKLDQVHKITDGVLDRERQRQTVEEVATQRRIEELGKRLAALEAKLAAAPAVPPVSPAP
jgi:chromosome segregation ATPase